MSHSLAGVAAIAVSAYESFSAAAQPVLAHGSRKQACCSDVLVVCKLHSQFDVIIMFTVVLPTSADSDSLSFFCSGKLQFKIQLIY